MNVRGILQGFILGIVTFALIIIVYSYFFPVEHVVLSPDNPRDILEFIGSARHSLDIEMYVLTDQNAIEHIIDAHERGVGVRVILENNVIDYENDRAYQKLLHAGVPVALVSRQDGVTHTKLIIVDGSRAYVGSHNLSRRALSKNREVGIITSWGPTINMLKEAFESDWTRAYALPDRDFI